MKKYIITAAQACGSPHSYFWKGICRYAKAIGAEIIVLPMIGRSAIKSQDWTNIHPLFDDNLLYGKLDLNLNLRIEQFNIRPYQIDPTTGLQRFAQQDRTVIFASPKQRLVPVAHSLTKYPKFLMTTGCVTRPNYAMTDEVSAERRRLGGIAKRDHIYGFVVVEILDNEMYHFRHVRANHRGEFVDLGVSYSGNRTKGAVLEAMVLGDYHNDQSDPTVLKATYEMIRELNPKRLILHDFFDGHSVSHHIDRKPVREKLIQIYDKHLHLLDGELKHANEELKRLSALMKGKPILLAFSNHHTFLARYLEEGRFAKDMPNFRTSSELLTYMAEKDYNDPVYAGIRKYGGIPKGVRFLREDEDYKVRGYQLAQHGDHNFSRMGYGSILSNEINYGKSIVGHSHSAEILRNSYVVGTMLPRNFYYMRGFPSKWTATHALIWNTGTVQMVNIIEGGWRG